MTKTVGLIGLGPMGGNVAGNLLEKKFSVCGFDLKPDCMSALADKGLLALGSAAEVSKAVDVVITSLPSFETLTSVIDELRQKPKEGQVVIECSTLTVEQKITAHDQLKDAGMIMLDAPISGHISKAVDGSLTIIVSGPKAAADHAKPAFEAMGENIFYIGDIAGGGQMMKLANNYLNNVQAIATSEAITMGIKFGLDPQIMFDILNVSTGRNSQTSGKLRDAVLSREFAGGANMKISHKDISLAVGEAESLGSPALTGALVRGIFEEALTKGGDKERSSAIFKYVAAKAGLDFGGDV